MLDRSATLGNTHLLLICIRHNGPSSNLEQLMGQKPINEGRQFSLKIEVIKIRQYTMFPCGVICSFFQVKENGKNMFFFGKSVKM